MTARKQGKLYDKWHKRVEGQIRHVIGQHPEWFNLKDERTQFRMVNSLAKRIVGEIVADCRLAPQYRCGCRTVSAMVGNGDAPSVSPSGCQMVPNCLASGNPDDLYD